MKKWIQLFNNAARAFGRVLRQLAARQPLTVEEATYGQRLEICGACPYHVAGRCLECGCFVRLKNILATETCPKQFWK